MAAILPRLPGEQVNHVGDLQETRAMLADRIQEWAEEAKQKGLQEGWQQGRQEGRQEGRREGEARLLLRLLQRRFGDLPDWVHPRLDRAPPEQLEQWGERLLEVDSLDALFDGDGFAVAGEP